MQSSLTRAVQPRHLPKEAVPYSSAAMRHDLERVRCAWEECQATRDRHAIYAYLGAVYGLVAVWAAEGREVERARRALRLRQLKVSDREEAFAAIIHRGPGQGRQTDPEQVEPSHALRGGVQVGFRASGSTLALLDSPGAWERRGWRDSLEVHQRMGWGCCVRFRQLRTCRREGALGSAMGRQETSVRLPHHAMPVSITEIDPQADGEPHHQSQPSGQRQAEHQQQ
jgi:hypothetical protein